jgi:uncharacterized membrane protein YeaQ/YmgE (transglycosylase-associated protein family)
MVSMSSHRSLRRTPAEAMQKQPPTLPLCLGTYTGGATALVTASCNEARRTDVGILAWIVVGLIAGWLAGQVMGSGFGLIGDIIIGIIGAVVGGYVAATFLDMPDAVNGINVPSIVVAFVGAVILLFILRMLGGRRRA